MTSDLFPYVHLAVEDRLGQALGERLLNDAGFGVASVLGLKGNGWLRANARKLNQAARQVPVLLLTDLDHPNACPVSLISEFLGSQRCIDLLLRICVLEAEAWILADAEAFSGLVGIRTSKIPSSPDEVRDPKEHLVNLARAGRLRAIKADLVPSRGSTAKIGPGYNPTLAEFIRTEWDPRRASLRSPSLARALSAIRDLRLRHPPL